MVYCYTLKYSAVHEVIKRISCSIEVMNTECITSGILGTKYFDVNTFLLLLILDFRPDTFRSEPQLKHCARVCLPLCQTPSAVMTSLLPDACREVESFTRPLSQHRSRTWTTFPGTPRGFLPSLLPSCSFGPSAVKKEDEKQRRSADTEPNLNRV